MGAIARVGAAWLGRSAVMFALWLALVDNLHSVELYVGAACAVLAGAAAVAESRVRGRHPRPTPWMLRRGHRPLVALVADTFRVALVLGRALAGRRPEGRLRAVRFAATADTPRDAARRSLAEVLGSLGPNRYVVGIDREREVLLVHELLPSDQPLDPLELG
jgi:hypothetical protein